MGQKQTYTRHLSSVFFEMSPTIDNRCFLSHLINSPGPYLHYQEIMENIYARF